MCNCCTAHGWSSLTAMQTAVGVCYLLGAFCWMTNATYSGWPSANSTLDEYLIGTTGVLGALLFHLGAMCQVWESLNNKQQHAVFTRLPSFAKEPWLDPPAFSGVTKHSDQPSDLESCSPVEAGSLTLSGSGRLQHFGSGRLSRSLTGISAESEVQLSERGCSPTGGSTSSVIQLGQFGDWGELCLRQGSNGALHLPCYPNAASEQQLDCPRLGSEQQHGPQHAQHYQEHLQLPTALAVLGLVPANSSSPQQLLPPLLQQREHRRTASSAPACAADCPGGLLESQSQQPQGLSPTGRTASLRIRQRSSSHSDCANDINLASGQKHGGSAGAHAAKSVRGLKAAGERQPWVLQQGSWVWWEWRPHELGFLAAVVQVVGTSIFFAACVCGFPGVLPTNYSAGDWIYWDAFFWAPFLVGSCLFITSALMSVRDCQGSWSKAQPRSKVWWMHVFNTVGSIGFWLCSFFGFFAHPAEKYQRWGMAFSCLWGSCCFAVAAHLQLLHVCNTLAFDEAFSGHELFTGLH